MNNSGEINLERFTALSVYPGSDSDGVLLPDLTMPGLRQSHHGKGFSNFSLTSVSGDFGQQILQNIIPCSRLDGRPFDITFLQNKVGIEVKTAMCGNTAVIRSRQIIRYINEFGLTNSYYSIVYYDVYDGDKRPRIIYIFPIRIINYHYNTTKKIGVKKEVQFVPMRLGHAKILFEKFSNSGLFISGEYTIPGIDGNPILRIIDFKETVAHVLSLDPNFISPQI